MKVVRYYGQHDLRVEEIDEPSIGPDTVKIAPAFNGICGSDLHLYEDGPIPPAPTADTPHPLSGETLPVVFGHEFAGTVEELGTGVDGLSVGESVAIEPLMVDGTCPACKRGTYNLCEELGFIGISGRGGGLSEHIVVQSQWVHPVGDIPLDQAAMIEPLSVATHAVKQTNAREGQVAVVGGAGPIGLLTAAVLHGKGLTVIVSEVSKERRDKANSAGVADVVVDPSNEDLHAVVAEHTDGFMADVAFDAAGVPAVVTQLIDVLAGDGRLQVIAVHTKPIELNIASQLMIQDRAIGASIGYAHDHPEAIELVRTGKIDLAPFITSRIKADDIIDKGIKALTGDTSEVKILVSMH